MQNRFTVKDFFYMLIGGVACLLLFLIIWKTQNEANVLDGLRNTVQQQQTVLGSLGDSIRGQQQAVADLAESVRELRESGGASIDPELLAQILKQNGNSGSQTNSADSSDAHRYQSNYNPKNRQAINTKSQNNEGLPQQWQTAPDAELPADFAPGDTLIQVWPTDAQKLTPLVSSDAYGRRVHWYTHEYLINFDLDAPFDYTPGLAKAWEVSEDGLTLTFHLFENATWSDGKPVTADDVIFTWDTVNNPKMDTAHYRAYTERVVDYRKIDEHTVQFTLNEPYFDAPGICGNLLIIVPKHIYGDYDPETFNTDIPDMCVGSGPYILADHVKNERIVLVRNENYWGPKPALERYEIRIIQNDLPKLQEFRAGNVDLIAPTSEQYIENSEAPWFKDRKARPLFWYSPRGGYNYIGYNLRRPYFSDKRVRQALTMLIDRQGLIDTCVEGLGRLISGPFFFKSDQYDQSVEPWPYDPERARALLKEAGWEDTDGDGVIDKDVDGDGARDPFEVTYLIPSGGSLGEKLQRFVYEAFQAGGIKLNLDQLEWTVFLERVNEREFDMITLSWTGNPEGDPTQIWHSSSEPNRGSNAVGFINPEADRLIEAGRKELDREKRMEIWHAFHQLIHEEQPYTFLYARPNQAFLDGRFKNVIARDYRLYPSEWYVPAPQQIR